MGDEIPGGPWTFGRVIIAVIIVAACIGILLVALNVFGIVLPWWIVNMFWIVVAATAAILVVKFLLKLF